MTKWMCDDCGFSVKAEKRPSRCKKCNGKMLSWGDRIAIQRKAEWADRQWELEQERQRNNIVNYAEGDAEITLAVYEEWKKRMGASPEATIIFGYVFQTENVWPWQAEEDFLEDGEEADIKREWEARDWYIHIALNKTVGQVEAMPWEEKKAIWDEVPIEVDPWGFMEDPCYMFFPKEACITTDWDSPQILEVGWFHNTEQLAIWVKQLNHFIAQMKIDVGDQKAAFRMVASYG